MAPVLSSTEGFPPGTNLSTWRWPQGTRMTAPLQVAVLPSSLRHPEGLPVEKNLPPVCPACVHVPRCVPCCAWSVPRPYTCVYV